MKKIILCMMLVVLGGCSLLSKNLKGMSKDEIWAEMGAPRSVMADETKEMWAYRQGNCSRFIFFDATETVQYVEEIGSCRG